jgi:aspartyl-tRNA synthetase
MHKRAPVQQTIAVWNSLTLRFKLYLESRRFKEYQPPCLIGAASEGGGNVFRLPYVVEAAFTAQSP